MMLSRRKAMAVIGGGTILAAGGAAAGFYSTRTPHAALAPWDAAGGYADPRKRALSYALLAPNPHNLQPWMVALEGEDRIALYRDPDRGLPHTDPFDRQIIIGFGCFLEQMAVAASLDGLSVRIEIQPDGPGGPVALATFLDGAPRDPLAGFMMDRRSCKEPFQMTEVPEALAAALAPFATIVTDPDAVADLRDLTWAAWLTEMQTPRTWKESVDLLRIGKAEIEANPDGIDLSGPLFDTLGPLGLMPREDMLAPDSTAVRQTMQGYREIMAATPAYAVLTSAGNTRADQIEAGRRWLRLNLATTQAGLALHPVSQCLQEYPEMAPHHERAHALMAGPGETVQMLGRLGYGPQTPRTPRWPLEAKLRDA